MSVPDNIEHCYDNHIEHLIPSMCHSIQFSCSFVEIRGSCDSRIVWSWLSPLQASGIDISLWLWLLPNCPYHVTIITTDSPVFQSLSLFFIAPNIGFSFTPDTTEPTSEWREPFTSSSCLSLIRFVEANKTSQLTHSHFSRQPRPQWAGPAERGGERGGESANNNNNEEEAGEEQDWPRPAKRRRSDPEHQEGVTPGEGRRLSPRPLPALPPWFHPPMALPLSAKEEVFEEGEGVTPPLMSPVSGLVSPFPGSTPGPGSSVMDPRHILHLLARKVRKLFTEISSNG